MTVLGLFSSVKRSANEANTALRKTYAKFRQVTNQITTAKTATDTAKMTDPEPKSQRESVDIEEAEIMEQARQARDDEMVHVPEVPAPHEPESHLEITKRSTNLDEDDEVGWDDAALSKSELHQGQANEGKGATIEKGEWVYIIRTPKYYG